MNLEKHVFVILFLFITMPLATASLDCRLGYATQEDSTGCVAGETLVFSYSDVGTGGEHVNVGAWNPLDIYPNEVCCSSDKTLSIGSQCNDSSALSDEAFVFAVPEGQLTNTHISSSISGVFNTPRCIKVSEGTISCAFVAGNCHSGQECLAKASDLSNAHVDDCDKDFAYSICCSTEGSVQGCNRDCSADGLCNVDCADDPFCSDDPDCCELECGAGDGCNSECETDLACPIDPDCTCPFQCDVSPCDSQCYTDPRCELGTNCSANPPSEICDNGLDDDLDGLTDCDDLDCASAPNCSAVSDVFDVSLEISPTSVDAGDTVTVSVTVLNKSSSQHSAQISVSVEDNVFSIPSETISVPAGASATKDFTPTVPSGAAEKVYKVTASVPAFGSERAGNNTVVKSFIVGSAPQAISVPDMSLALIPFLAIIVLALIYRRK